MSRERRGDRWNKCPGHPQKRVDIDLILCDKEMRRDMFVRTIVAIQAREGIETTTAQAERAYDTVRNEICGK